ncbi:YppF family protein [Bacillus sp. V5-8f]|uniref:YppF family protein n=1 Tax=Bacillus sp. V5-8f TaxID=2053044 RepID=UPI000C769DD3|nr:YppF family protein [Bacillus sp. V5-8f]PLT35225.1 hypothetical protein CUU64_07580 [Bacillus sp. V5-8f]
MKIERLITNFIISKSHLPTHANVLLDHARKEYILGKISIKDYRELLQELSKRGATLP